MDIDPGPNSDPRGWPGRSVMTQLPIGLVSSGLTLSHPIAGELSVSNNHRVSARPAQETGIRGSANWAESVPYPERMAQACQYISRSLRAVILFSNVTKTFSGKFDPMDIAFDNKNNIFFGVN